MREFDYTVVEKYARTERSRPSHDANNFADGAEYQFEQDRAAFEQLKAKADKLAEALESWATYEEEGIKKWGPYVNSQIPKYIAQAREALKLWRGDEPSEHIGWDADYGRGDRDEGGIMGLFNRVITMCECGANIEWQSKCGEYGMNTYRPENVPIEIAKDINGERAECYECKKSYRIIVSPRDISNVKMEVE